MYTPHTRGFFKLILIVTAALLILGYFNIDLKSTIESPTNQENVSYIKERTTHIWETYLKKPVLFFWNNIFINLLWNAFTSNMERVRDGKPTDFELWAPQVAPPAPSVGASNG